MHLFAIIVAKNDSIELRKVNNLLSGYEKSIIPFKNPKINEWISNNKKLYVKSWYRKDILYSCNDLFHYEMKRSILHLFDGWILFPGKSPKDSLSELKISEKPSDLINDNNFGEFSYTRLDENGNGLTYRNKSGLVPIYYAQNSEVQIISNRASVASLIKYESCTFEIDPIFQVSMLGIGWPLFNNTLFKDISSIHPRNKISIKNFFISVSDNHKDIYYDEYLNTQLSNNKKKYWDDLFDILCESTKLFMHIEDKYPITFFLSGGKDSRLIFSLFLKSGLLNRLDIVSTGAPYSHDVIVPQQITSHYNIKQRFTDSVFKDVNYSNLLPSHVFLCEGRTGPYNMSYFNERSNIVTLTGHEIGLREDIITSNFGNIDNHAVRLMNRSYFGDFNYAGVIKHNIQKEFSDNVDAWLNKAIQNTADIRNVPWRFRNESRCSGYLGFVKFLGEFQKGFAPYLLMTDMVLKRAYNAGCENRASERLHYEMLKRVDPWLVYKCPFGGQKWSKYLSNKLGQKLPPEFPILKSKRTPKLGAFAVFEKNREDIFKYILQGNNEIFEFIEKGKVITLSKEENLTDKKLRIVWNMFMFTYINNNKDLRKFSTLKATNYNSDMPNIKLKISPKIDDDIYKNKNKINALIEKSALADSYRDVMIQLLWEANYSKRGDSLVTAGKVAMKDNRYEDAFLNFYAANQFGNDTVKLDLGRLYFSGKGVEKNLKKAIECFKDALNAGNSNAAFELAKCYDNGLGIKKNQKRALQLYIEAIDAGNLWGLERAGDITYDLNPVSDYQSLWNRAVDFYKSKAELGLSFCAYRICEMIKENKVSQINILRDKLKWFNIAKKGGFYL